MKNLKYIVLSILLSFCHQSVMAQGVKIYMKDKSVVEIPYTQLDSIVAYDKASVAYEWIDLGLPSGLLWASCNVGAAVPEEYGDYFAWGEIVPKESYDRENNLTANRHMSDIFGNPQYEAATANWGAPARMPKKAEMDELYKYCTTTWTSRNGVNGRLMTGKNGNSIFLPAAGHIDGTWLDNAGEDGGYWSCSPGDKGDENAYSLGFCNDFFYWTYDLRYTGYSVRPVRDK